MTWWLLVLSLPSEGTAARMRAWRALKAAGAAVLRDGVYLLPERDDCRAAFAAVADGVHASGGTACVLRADGDDAAGFPALFDRSADYAALLDELTRARASLNAATADDTLRRLRKWRRSFDELAAIDYFPGEAQRQARAVLQELEASVQRLLAPVDEPHAAHAAAIVPRRIADYRGRRWATRRRPWVDRLACAWLIRRFIDPDAEFIWLNKVADCPRDALGFDFDGATFSHVGARVSFETMLASFSLERPSLLRLGALVHYLDAGGVQPAEAQGVERVLAGLREAIADDDQLLQQAASVFEALYTVFEKESA
jgi:hypothetical protein